MDFMSLMRENREKMTADNTNRVIHLPIDSVMPNPDPSRQVFDDSELWQLSYSIKTYGVMQPVIVRKLGTGVYELIAGERRLRASRLAGKKTIPAVLFEASHDAAMILNMVENTQRSNLNFVEEAKGYDHFMKRYGYTTKELAEKIGRNPFEIENKVRILKLPADVVKKLAGHHLTEFHANALLRLADRELQRETIDVIISRGLDVAQTDAFVDKLLSRNFCTDHGKQKIKDERIVTNTLQQLAAMLNRSGIAAAMRKRDLKNCVQYTLTVAKSENHTAQKDSAFQTETFENSCYNGEQTSIQ